VRTVGCVEAGGRRVCAPTHRAGSSIHSERLLFTMGGLVSLFNSSDSKGTVGLFLDFESTYFGLCEIHVLDWRRCDGVRGGLEWPVTVAFWGKLELLWIVYGLFRQVGE